MDGKILVTFNARNEHDRCKFAEDLRESISEMDEMESLRIESELERQKSARSSRNGGSASSENRDSGMCFIYNYFKSFIVYSPKGTIPCTIEYTIVYFLFSFIHLVFHFQNSPKIILFYIFIKSYS